MTLRWDRFLLAALAAAALGCGGGSADASREGPDGETTADNPDAHPARDGGGVSIDSGMSTSTDGGQSTIRDSGGAGGDSTMSTSDDSKAGTNDDSGPSDADSGMPTGADAGSEGGDAARMRDGAEAESNVAPLIVDTGPGVNSSNTPFVTVTICVPGTTTCQTIDHIIVDTGSSGVHIVASVLHGNMMLPPVRVSAGSVLVDCQPYVNSVVWGGVHTADVKIAGEIAPSIPIQVVGDPGVPRAPSSCGSASSVTDTVSSYGGNGLLGINQTVADCGPSCAATPVQPGGYYSCTGSKCTPVALPEANQVSNPIAFFEKDNNGAIVSFPPTRVPEVGAPSLAGALIFGIGTQANNAIGSATVLTTDDFGNLTTVFNGKSLTESYFDTGTNEYAFNDSSIAECKANDFWAGSDCPASTLNLTALNRGLNGATKSASFAVANADTMSRTDAVLPDLAGPADGTGSFGWGFPFFIGRNVYIALAGSPTPGGSGPYYAY